MKKLFMAAAIMLLGVVGAMGQGTLQFNQVKLVDATTATVPSGKVWKVEAIMIPKISYVKYNTNQGGSCSCGAGNSARLYVTDYWPLETANNTVINGIQYKLSNGAAIWLPAGTTLQGIQSTSPMQTSTDPSGCYSSYYIDGAFVGCGPYTPTQVTSTIILSVIEFNVIP